MCERARCATDQGGLWCKEQLRPSEAGCSECLGTALDDVEVSASLPDPAGCCSGPQQRVEEPLPAMMGVPLTAAPTCGRATANPEETCVRFWAAQRGSDISEFLLISLKMWCCVGPNLSVFLSPLLKLKIFNRNLALSRGVLFSCPGSPPWGVTSEIPGTRRVAGRVGV